MTETTRTSVLQNSKEKLCRFIESKATERQGFDEYREETHYLRLYITYLRQKLEKDPANPKYILTERGVGYRFIDFRKTLDQNIVFDILAKRGKADLARGKRNGRHRKPCSGGASIMAIRLSGAVFPRKCGDTSSAL